MKIQRLNPVAVAGQTPRVVGVRQRVSRVTSGRRGREHRFDSLSPTPAPHHLWASIPTLFSKLRCHLARCGSPERKMAPHTLREHLPSGDAKLQPTEPYGGTMRMGSLPRAFSPSAGDRCPRLGGAAV